jgi:hypothetical protein
VFSDTAPLVDLVVEDAEAAPEVALGARLVVIPVAVAVPVAVPAASELELVGSAAAAATSSGLAILAQGLLADAAMLFWSTPM